MMFCSGSAILFISTILLLYEVQVNGASNSDNQSKPLNEPIYSRDEVENALSVLVSVGVETDLLCHRGVEELDSIIPPCVDLPSVEYRMLHGEEGEEEVTKNTMFYVINGGMALLCVSAAALAAGLTMGLLSLEVLDLKIKEMASSSEEEKISAGKLIPLLKDHHRLLVTLLLLNACANEALPIFLDSLVPSYVAVILSVTLVLFFGEIIPTAIFAGPRKLAIASSLSFVVNFLLFILAPLAVPIARLLDFFLHEHDDDGTNTKYNRNEIAALVKIQHEDRMRAKRERKKRRKFSDSVYTSHSFKGSPTTSESKNLNIHRYSIHLDEVTMVEGALAMQIKTAKDVMTPLKKVYAIPDDMKLDQTNMVEIYRRGYSRIPIYANSKEGTEDDNLEAKAAIVGVLLTRKLIVVSGKENQPLSKIDWQTPHCVSPNKNMVELMNLFQAGGDETKGGHMAIVCMNPEIAKDYLKNKKPIPAEAGMMGVITLEDCVEELIQEEIYDEFDIEEKKGKEVLQRAINKRETVMKQKKLAQTRDEDTIDETTTLVNKTGATLV